MWNCDSEETEKLNGMNLSVKQVFVGPFIEREMAEVNK